MVYCDGVEVDSKLGKLIQAFRCDRPDEWTMDGFIRMAEDMHQEITRLREAEMDAARYRWMRKDGIPIWLDMAYGESMDDMVDQAMKEQGDE